VLPQDLVYSALTTRLARYQAMGLPESAAFLTWFLVHIYRLDETAAADSICDHPVDKGIDGIYVDHTQQEIHFLQCKIRQKETGTVGDNGLKALAASLAQFDTGAKVQAVLTGNANAELKSLLRRNDVASLIDKGYRPHGIYVTNERRDADAAAYLALTDALTLYDRDTIAAHFVDVAMGQGIQSTFTFSTAYADLLSLSVPQPTGKSAQLFVFPASASELVDLEGISNGSLFQNNVRNELGRTSVNKSIHASVIQRTGHADFLLFHNGIILLCDEADDSIPGQLTVRNYSVVNGAQSLTSFFRNKSSLTADLRVLVRVISVQDDILARKITENSNNQNAIKPRDLRSTDLLQLRLQKEIDGLAGGWFFEIKRGEAVPEGRTSLSNDDAGRELLAFDLHEPWSSHQIYKVFDERYQDIFARPEVTAERIILVHRLAAVARGALDGLDSRPMASYSLTKYFVLYVLSRIIRLSAYAKGLVSSPSKVSDAELDHLMATASDILRTIIVDANYEIKKIEGFDYKAVLKSSKQSIELADSLVSSYEKDLARGKADRFAPMTS